MSLYKLFVILFIYFLYVSDGEPDAFLSSFQPDGQPDAFLSSFQPDGQPDAFLSIFKPDGKLISCFLSCSQRDGKLISFLIVFISLLALLINVHWVVGNP